MVRRKTPQVSNESRVTIAEPRQKQPFVPQGILVGKLDFGFIYFIILRLIYLDSDEEGEDIMKSYAVC